MDVKRENNSGKKISQTKLIVMSVTFLVFVIVWQLTKPTAEASANRSELWFAKVQKGTLEMNVDAYGTLQSYEQRLLASPSKGVVEEVLLKPGAAVEVGSVILKLNNPELIQQVEKETRELENTKSALKQLRIEVQREYLAQEANLAQLEGDTEAAQLELSARKTLAEKGIVSALDFKKSQLSTKQLLNRLKIEKKRLAQLEEAHIESIKIFKDKIKQQQAVLEGVIDKKNRLLIRSGIKGVLQKLPVELGQSVNEGEQLALVGSTDRLNALLHISQSQIEKIRTGQSVDITIRGEKIKGSIIRIDPVVTNGSVVIEVELNGDLPSNARPELVIDAVINTGTIENALYIKNPVNVRANSQSILYRLISEGEQAEATTITFGMQSRTFTQILKGANLGDEFVLSDTSPWNDRKIITIR